MSRSRHLTPAQRAQRRRDRADFLRTVDAYQVKHFPGRKGPRVQYQHRSEQVEARERRRARLIELLGPALRFRAAGACYGSSYPGRRLFGLIPRGPTQEQLARELGVSRSTISRDLAHLQVELLRHKLR